MQREKNMIKAGVKHEVDKVITLEQSTKFEFKRINSILEKLKITAKIIIDDSMLMQMV